MTSSTEARWVQREGRPVSTVSSVCYCNWPRCPSRFPSARGPAMDGWAEFGVTVRKVLLCPFHSTSEHRPQLTLPDRDVLTVRSGCLCGWPGEVCMNTSDAIREWQEHVETLA